MTNARPTKHRRQHLVVRLLADNEVSSQEQLVELLGNEGIAATQATRLLAEGTLDRSWWDWNSLLAAFAAIFIVAGVVLMDFVAEE